MREVTEESPVAPADRLLLSIAEQLKLPLLQIARQAELGVTVGRLETMELLTMQQGAEAALKLVDSYLLGLQLHQEQASLALEPVSLSSTLVDIAHQLESFARPYNTEIEVFVAGKYPPVMAHAAGLRAAFLSLGAVLIQAVPSQTAELRHKPFVRLAVHRTPKGLVTGLYSEHSPVTATDLQRAQILYGRARQPFAELTASSGAGVFVADSILQAMASRLRVGHYQKLTGLAATLQGSRQLQLV